MMTRMAIIASCDSHCMRSRNKRDDNLDRSTLRFANDIRLCFFVFVGHNHEPIDQDDSHSESEKIICSTGDTLRL